MHNGLLSKSGTAGPVEVHMIECRGGCSTWIGLHDFARRLILIRF
jgi:hypothetical protein